MADSLRGLSTSHGVAVLATVMVFWLLATGAVVLRVWSLSISDRSIQLHDYFMFVALVGLMKLRRKVLVANQILSSAHGALPLQSFCVSSGLVVRKRQAN
jgi:hypothetical protein